jgi:hypothetical protein
MDKLEIKQGSFIQQTQYFIPVEIDLSVVPTRLGIWLFHLSRRTTVIQDLLVRRQFSLVPDNRTNVNVEACIKHQKSISQSHHVHVVSISLKAVKYYSLGQTWYMLYVRCLILEIFYTVPKFWLSNHTSAYNFLTTFSTKEPECISFYKVAFHLVLRSDSIEYSQQL